MYRHFLFYYFATPCDCRFNRPTPFWGFLPRIKRFNANPSSNDKQTARRPQARKALNNAYNFLYSKTSSIQVNFFNKILVDWIKIMSQQS